MFEHVSIGVKNLDNARTFYDALLGPLGYQRLANSETASGYGSDRAQFWVFKTETPVVAHPKSGLHFCFAAPTKDAVGAFHAAGVSGGGEDNGQPGLRAEYATFYYAAFIIDPDGYRLEAFCRLPD